MFSNRQRARLRCPRRDGGTSKASLILEVIPFSSLSGQIKRNVQPSRPKQTDKMRKEHQNCGAIFAAVTVLSLVTASAFAFGLSDEDYDYLKAKQIERSDAPMRDLSPKERTRVHDLINDPQTASDPSARDRNVKDALNLFLEHQLWEKEHPGELWDAPKR